MGIQVRLSNSEVLLGAEVGIMRQVSALRKGRKDKPSIDPADGWRAHIEGACGELAVAKYFNRFWSGTIGRVDARDVGDLEVRTASKPTGDLILRRGDKVDARYILTTGRAPVFELMGWLWGREGMRPEFWCDPNGKGEAYFIPQTALHPMNRDQQTERIAA